MVIPVCTYMVFLWFFFFPEQYRLHAKQGDAASAGNFSHSHHSTLNELFFCVFWKRFVSNGGLHFTLHTFTRFYEFLGLKVKLVASLNLARVASFPFLGILPMISAVPGLHLSQPDAATMLLGEKKGGSLEKCPQNGYIVLLWYS